MCKKFGSLPSAVNVHPLVACVSMSGRFWGAERCEAAAENRFLIHYIIKASGARKQTQVLRTETAIISDYRRPGSCETSKSKAKIIRLFKNLINIR